MSVKQEIAAKPLKPEEDDDQNFIKKDSTHEQKETSETIEPKNFETAKNASETQNIIGKLRNFIFPKNNQQRNLDQETGGLEAEEKKEISVEDTWDDRSKEVDEMGSNNTFESTGIKSVIAKKKREKLETTKEAIEAAAINKKLKGKNSGNLLEKIQPQQKSYVERLKNLEQDRSHEKGGGISA